MPGHYELRPCSRTHTISITDESCITRVLSRTIPAQALERDGKCVITNRNQWTALQVAHIVPLSSEDYFVRIGFSRWITNRKDERNTGITHVRVDRLCKTVSNALFDDFAFSASSTGQYERGGEPSFETDFVPGTEIMHEVIVGPDAAKPMEASFSQSTYAKTAQAFAEIWIQNGLNLNYAR
ncbi:hypothetical protein V1505DRAFT_398470 [Lipomyces doorenjongii]